MNKRAEMAYSLRQPQERHYNCCQSVFIPFCDICDIDAETAYRLGSNFGGGMRIGSVCGALTGGLMVLGKLERSEQEVRDFIGDFEKKHGSVLCSELLKKVSEQSPNPQMCNGLVVDCVEAIERIIGEK